MGCSCRKNRTAGGNPILGYQYTFQGVSTTFLNKRDATKQQIRNGGGTIKTLYGSPPSN
jgi:hypothetical protein